MGVLKQYGNESVIERFEVMNYPNISIIFRLLELHMMHCSVNSTVLGN